MVGRLLGERYRLDAELGRGGMGIVYRAHDSLLDRDVAVKLLSSAGLDTEARARLLHEAQAAAGLNHPNIVTIYDAGEAQLEAGGLPDSTSVVPFIVMELVSGKNLHEMRPRDLPEVLELAAQVCEALEHAHSHGIIHRDLKPENVLIAPRAPAGLHPSSGLGAQAAASGTAKLLDFGLARSVASRLTTMGSVSGTVYYLAPETVQGQAPDPRTDLYALGVMLYELTTGTLPFEADDPVAVISQHLHAPVVPPRARVPAIPAALDALIVRLLSKQPRDRPASAAEVRQSLASLVDVAHVHEAEPSPLEQLARGRLVGREKEFAAAKRQWREASSGEGEQRVLLITGEAGVGKSPLVRELRALAEISGGRTLRGICYSQGNAPYGPVAQVLREAIALLDVELDDLVLDGLIAIAPDLRMLFPDVPASPPLDPHSERQRLFESVVSVCAALATCHPLLLVFEDVQWADGGTLILLRHLARRSQAAGLRLLIVLTYREAEVSGTCCLNDVLLDLDRLRLASRIKLARLDWEQTREQLAVLLQDEVSDAFVDHIYRETEGNPFFVEEMVKALIEDGLLLRKDSHWDWSSMERLRLPQSVRTVIQSRVSRLPSGSQAALLLAAVIGREFDFDTLLAAGDLDEEALIDGLEAAEQALLIAEVEAAGGTGREAGKERFRFAHKLTATTLREGVSGLRRRRLHRRVAESIRSLSPGDDSRLEELAYHYAQAGDEQNALVYARQAADRARRVYANEEAIRLYTECLDLMGGSHPERFEVLSARSQVYDIVARRVEQQSDVAEMLTLADRLEDDARRCDALLAQADLYLETTSLRAREPAERAAAIARGLGDPVREGHALRRLGQEARYRYDHAASRAALEAAAERFRAAGLKGGAAESLHLLSLALGDLGLHADALEAAREALALSRSAGDRLQEATSLRRLAIVYLTKLDYAQALPYAEEALGVHRRTGDKTEECRALNVLGVICGWLGRLEEAGARLFEALELAKAIGYNMGVRSAVINLLWAFFRWQGEYEAGLALLDEQLAEARQAGDEVLAGHLHGQYPLLLSLMGQFEPALESAEALQPALDWLVTAEVQARYLAFMGGILAELGDYGQAHRRLEEALERAGATGAAADLAFPLMLQAYVALLEGGPGDLHRGLQQAERAVALLRETASTEDLIEALHRAAQLKLALARAGAEPASAHAAGALAHSTEVMALTDTWPCRPAAYLYTHFCALGEAGRVVEAEAHLRHAYQRVMLVARKTHDESLRRGWLEKVRINRQIQAAHAALRHPGA